MERLLELIQEKYSEVFPRENINQRQAYRLLCKIPYYVAKKAIDEEDGFEDFLTYAIREQAIDVKNVTKNDRVIIGKMFGEFLKAESLSPNEYARENDLSSSIVRSFINGAPMSLNTIQEILLPSQFRLLIVSDEEFIDRTILNPQPLLPPEEGEVPELPEPSNPTPEEEELKELNEKAEAISKEALVVTGTSVFLDVSSFFVENVKNNGFDGEVTVTDVTNVSPIKATLNFTLKGKLGQESKLFPCTITHATVGEYDKIEDKTIQLVLVGEVTDEIVLENALENVELENLEGFEPVLVATGDTRYKLGFTVNGEDVGFEFTIVVVVEEQPPTEEEIQAEKERLDGLVTSKGAGILTENKEDFENLDVIIERLFDGEEEVVVDIVSIEKETPIHASVTFKLKGNFEQVSEEVTLEYKHTIYSIYEEMDKEIAVEVGSDQNNDIFISQYADAQISTKGFGQFVYELTSTDVDNTYILDYTYNEESIKTPFTVVVTVLEDPIVKAPLKDTVNSAVSKTFPQLQLVETEEGKNAEGKLETSNSELVESLNDFEDLKAETIAQTTVNILDFMIEDEEIDVVLSEDTATENGVKFTVTFATTEETYAITLEVDLLDIIEAKSVKTTVSLTDIDGYDGVGLPTEEQVISALKEPYGDLEVNVEGDQGKYTVTVTLWNKTYTLAEEASLELSVTEEELVQFVESDDHVVILDELVGGGLTQPINRSDIEEAIVNKGFVLVDVEDTVTEANTETTPAKRNVVVTLTETEGILKLQTKPYGYEDYSETGFQKLKEELDSVSAIDVLEADGEEEKITKIKEKLVEYENLFNEGVSVRLQGEDSYEVIFVLDGEELVLGVGNLNVIVPEEPEVEPEVPEGETETDPDPENTEEGQDGEVDVPEEQEPEVTE